ncbi:hypothetical protein H9P43_001980 [Blastocladiella emersonii ATCC 22665]|nr:hypothetical protein H9P43_001980 [Blastocladiella emersonii ATCC 22665]
MNALGTRRTTSPADGEVLPAAGHPAVTWDSAAHPRLEALESIRAVADPVCDAALAALLECRAAAAAASGTAAPVPFSPKDSLAAYLAEVAVPLAQRMADEGFEESTLAPGDRAILALWDEVKAAPDWVSWPVVARAVEVFWKYYPAMNATLVMSSLFNLYSIESINRILASTGGLANKRITTVQRRLTETTQMIFEAMRGADALRAGNNGWAAVLNVRFLHAMVRHRVAQRGETVYSAADHGAPINQGDMLATALVFGPVVVRGVERLLGAPMPAQDQADYMHLWGFLTHLLGVRLDLNPMAPARATAAATAHARECGWIGAGATETARGLDDEETPADAVRHAQHVCDAVLVHLYHPTPLSREFGSRLLEGGATMRTNPMPVTRLAWFAHVLLGPEHAAKLGADPVLGWWARVDLWYQLTMMRAVVAAWDAVPALRGYLFGMYNDMHNDAFVFYAVGKHRAKNTTYAEVSAGFAFPMRENGAEMAVDKETDLVLQAEIASRAWWAAVMRWVVAAVAVAAAAWAVMVVYE